MVSNFSDLKHKINNKGLTLDGLVDDPGILSRPSITRMQDLSRGVSNAVKFRRRYQKFSSEI